MSRIPVETAIPVNAAWGLFVANEDGTFEPCESYAVAADGSYLSGDGDDIRDKIAAGVSFITYEASFSKRTMEERAARETTRWAENAARYGWAGRGVYVARPLPNGALLHRDHDEALCIVRA